MGFSYKKAHRKFWLGYPDEGFLLRVYFRSRGYLYLFQYHAKHLFYFLSIHFHQAITNMIMI